MVQKAAVSGELAGDMGRGLVEIISRYTQTQRFDEGLLEEPKGIVGGKLPGLDETRAAIVELKQGLMARGEATELFGLERPKGWSVTIRCEARLALNADRPTES